MCARDLRTMTQFGAAGSLELGGGSGPCIEPHITVILGLTLTRILCFVLGSTSTVGKEEMEVFREESRKR